MMYSLRAYFICITTVAVCFCTPPAWAQKQVPHNYLVELSGLSDRGRSKVVLAAFNDQDPQALCSISLELQQVKVRMLPVLDRAALEARLATGGMTIVRINDLTPVPLMDRTMDITQQPGFPQYVDTGHPEEDAANYRQRKIEWLNAHPASNQAPGHAPASQ